MTKIIYDTNNKNIYIKKLYNIKPQIKTHIIGQTAARWR